MQDRNLLVDNLTKQLRYTMGYLEEKDKEDRKSVV